MRHFRGNAGGARLSSTRSAPSLLIRARPGDGGRSRRIANDVAGRTADEPFAPGGIPAETVGMVMNSNARPAFQTTTTSARWPCGSLPASRIALSDPCEPSRLMSTGPVEGMVAPVGRGRRAASLAGALGLPLRRATRRRRRARRARPWADGP